MRTFDTIEELRAALVEFATRYNETWLVARHGAPTIQNYDEQKRCRDSKVHPRRGIAPHPVLQSENEKYAAGHRQANDAENLDNRNFLR